MKVRPVIYADERFAADDPIDLRQDPLGFAATKEEALAVFHSWLHNNGLFSPPVEIAETPEAFTVITR